MRKHFVTFLSPGTFVNEESELPIDSWDVEKAQQMAHGITERHGATPFAFYFTTRSRSDQELDSREVERGINYFLGGEVLTLAQVKAQNDPKNSILISNMQNNGYKKVLVNRNSWKITVPFDSKDVILDWKPKLKKAAK
jgi:hypothetical protein